MTTGRINQVAIFPSSNDAQCHPPTTYPIETGHATRRKPARAIRCKPLNNRGCLHKHWKHKLALCLPSLHTCCSCWKGRGISSWCFLFLAHVLLHNNQPHTPDVRGAIECRYFAQSMQKPTWSNPVGITRQTQQMLKGTNLYSPLTIRSLPRYQLVLPSFTSSFP